MVLNHEEQSETLLILEEVQMVELDPSELHLDSSLQLPGSAWFCLVLPGSAWFCLVQQDGLAADREAESVQRGT